MPRSKTINGMRPCGDCKASYPATPLYFTPLQRKNRDGTRRPALDSLCHACRSQRVKYSHARHPEVQERHEAADRQRMAVEPAFRARRAFSSSQYKRRTKASLNLQRARDIIEVVCARRGVSVATLRNEWTPLTAGQRRGYFKRSNAALEHRDWTYLLLVVLLRRHTYWTLPETAALLGTPALPALKSTQTYALRLLDSPSITSFRLLCRDLSLQLAERWGTAPSVGYRGNNIPKRGIPHDAEPALLSLPYLSRAVDPYAAEYALEKGAAQALPVVKLDDIACIDSMKKLARSEEGSWLLNPQGSVFSS